MNDSNSPKNLRRGVVTATLLITTVAAIAPTPASAGRNDVAVSTTGHRDSRTCRGLEATHVNEDGSPGNDVILVTEPIEVNGWNGDDLICVKMSASGYGANIDGGNGDDTIITYSGENFVYGGADNDSILSNSADHVLDGEDGHDTIYMGRHADVFVYGGDGHDKIFGTPFGDAIHAGAGNDFVMGFDGDDSIDGGTGNDELSGGAGFDTLDGHAGSDTCSDVAAPGTVFVSCETLVTVALPQGPGGLAGS